MLRRKLTTQFCTDINCFRPGTGVVLLAVASERNRSRLTRHACRYVGMLLAAVSYLVVMMFIRIKMPGYLS
ncbi:hypothetical protein DUNSADRAFT_1001 [Dunaliella salina]|uniref:Encoded protein n=1 Tax=Dunaliella salina TaxID=3046 RepID=A0ABQ7FYG2_DUNSA|nr:hypothetical protein DUNSADRAFT_1001 [Dunaliella salina]|eukprot:KAF5827284.1 hypothetical protein DUNSADRAFT_1001 [Dunaliella salina]